LESGGKVEIASSAQFSSRAAPAWRRVPEDDAMEHCTKKPGDEKEILTWGLDTIEGGCGRRFAKRSSEWWKRNSRRRWAQRRRPVWVRSGRVIATVRGSGR